MADVRLPDGTIVKNVPEGITKSELMRRLGREYGKPSRDERIASLAEKNPAEYDPSSPEFQAKYGATAGMSTLDKLKSGAGSFFTDIGLGIQQRIGIAPDEAATEKAALDAPLMATGAGKVGKIGAGIVSTIPALAIPGANTVAGAALTGAGVGSVMPAESGFDLTKNIALGAAGGAVGQKGGELIGRGVASALGARQAAAAAQTVQNQSLRPVVEEAISVGYKIPPSTSNPTKLNALIEGTAGKLTTAQGAAVRNQTVTNNLAKEAIGLPKNAPLSLSAIKTVRGQANKIYDEVADAVDFAPVDQQYLDDLVKLKDTSPSILESFPDFKPAADSQIDDLINSLLVDRFSSKSAIEIAKQLRKESKDLLRSFDDPMKRSLGFAKRKAADAVEGALFREAERRGLTGIAQRFNEARTLLAKTHTVDNALNRATGNIDPKVIAREFDAGKPLTGELEIIGKFANAFPKASKETTESFPLFSPLDLYAGGGIGLGGIATGNPSALLLPFLRPAARNALLSGVGQRALATPSANVAPGIVGNTLLRTGGLLGRVGLPIGAILPGQVMQQ